MDVPKTLDDIRAVKGVFPADEIETGDSVLDLMCAGFYGANAAIHVIDRKPSRYVGVDIDDFKLRAMRDVYPEDVCRYREQLADDYVEWCIANRVLFDVVICDPWTNGIAEWMPRLFALRRVAWRTVILGTFLGWLSDNGRDPTPESMTAWAKARAEEMGEPDPPTCTRVIRRSDHLGGTFWTVWR